MWPTTIPKPPICNNQKSAKHIKQPFQGNKHHRMKDNNPRGGTNEVVIQLLQLTVLTEFPICTVVDQDSTEDCILRRWALIVSGNQGLLVYRIEYKREESYRGREWQKPAGWLQSSTEHWPVHTCEEITKS